MQGLHIMWSLPQLYNRRDNTQTQTQPPASKKYPEFQDYDLLLTVLSILKWKQLNGPMRLYADSPTVTHFAKLGLLDLWDDYNSEVLDNLDCSRINPSLFWAAAKFFVYLQEPAPFVAMDMDLIVWQNLERFYSGVDARFTHWEAVEPSIWYCRRKDLRRPFNYSFKRAWTWSSTMAANTAIVYFGNQAFKNYYAGESIRYMTDNSLGIDFPKTASAEILFAEQRLLTMCAKEQNRVVLPFLDAIWNAQRGSFTRHDHEFGAWDFAEVQNQPLLTHGWFHKWYLRDTPSARDEYCYKLGTAIKKEFPADVHRLRHIQQVGKYL